MSFSLGEGVGAQLLERVQQLQAEGKIILPDELVRRVKAGPGPDSLGQAQQVGQAQSGEQHVIDAETLAIVGNLESAWTGQGGEAARMGLRPLADVSTSASTAMHDSHKGDSPSYAVIADGKKTGIRCPACD